MADDRLKGVSSTDYFLIACGKCSQHLFPLFRASGSGPVIDYKCQRCGNSGTLKLQGTIQPD